MPADSLPPLDPRLTAPAGSAPLQPGEQALHLAAGETRVLPLVEERIEVVTRQRDDGAVRVRKHVQAHVETVELPGWSERAHVERVAIDRPADAVQPPRREGEVWVVPVYEERWVTVKQLYLREELRISTVREQQLRREDVTVQREQVAIERLDPVSGQWHPASAPLPLDEGQQSLAAQPLAPAATAAAPGARSTRISQGGSA